ncbi:MAG: hypothetical protein HQL41_07395, partial [Alphaproteobacteria bacterium]|nr:hypothetical protein [Alphaproteobacteria bacterium]
ALKSFPTAPLLLSQNGAPTAPSDLATAATWTFRLVYSHDHAPQDRVIVTVAFNLSPPPAKARAAAGSDLFTALAQYVAVADDLNGLLDSLGDPGGSARPEVANAVTTFADLAERIADAWAVRLPNDPIDPADDDDWVPAESHAFAVAVTTTGKTDRLLDTVVLTRLGATLPWPKLACETVGGRAIPMVLDTPTSDPNQATFRPLNAVALPAGTRPVLSLAWPDLTVGAVQNARTSLEVVRNADLLGPQGPATDPRFVYRTATVTATDIVTPSITRPSPFALSGASLADALQTALDQLFPPALRLPGLTLTVGASYVHPLVDGPDPLYSELPAGLFPNLALDGDTGRTIADALTTWLDRVQPDTRGAVWAISLMLDSTVDPGGRVLLTVDRLLYPLTAA